MEKGPFITNMYELYNYLECICENVTPYRNVPYMPIPILIRHHVLRIYPCIDMRSSKPFCVV